MESQIQADSWSLLAVLWPEEPPAHGLTTLLIINHWDVSINISERYMWQINCPRRHAEELATYK